MGRPTDYNETIANSICERLADGESLRAICSGDGMPSRASVFRWLGSHQEFRDQYARARDEQAEAFADEIVSISDEADVTTKVDGEDVTLALDATGIARNRLRIDARKWVASKLKPKKYGENVNLSGHVTLEQLVASSMGGQKESAE